MLLASWLFGDSQTVLNLLVHPFLLWAVFFSIILFPINQGMTEIPLYFITVMPRIKAQNVPRWLAIDLPSLILGLQHFAVPFVFDIRFIAWRALMFIPFAFCFGIVRSWQLRLLPYIAVIHVLMDLSFAIMLLSVVN